MDIYNSIASWLGWPPIVALLLLLGGFGVWFSQKHIDFLKDEIASLERKLMDCLNFTPDVVAQRLADRAKLLQSEITELINDREQHESKINTLKHELEETQNEALDMRTKLNKIEEVLLQLEEPRDGKFIPSIESAILRTVKQQSVIYIPIESPYGRSGFELSKIANNSSPFKFEVSFPGMMKMYLLVYNNGNELIGTVANPYFGVHYKDYLVTLLSVLSHVPSEMIAEGIQHPPAGLMTLTTSEYHSQSPIDPDIIYLRINCNESMFAYG